MKFKSWVSALTCCLALVGARSEAAVIVGGISFDDNAFADTLVSSSGSWTAGGGAADLADALTGSNPNDYAFAFGSTANVVLGFTDNVVVNGTGADLAIFDLGTAEIFALVINSITRTYTFTPTGFNAGIYNLGVAQIDLSDFGLGAGATISSLQLFPSPTDSDPADFTVIGAINNGPAAATVPEPASLALTFAALGIGLVAGRRSRRRLAG